MQHRNGDVSLMPINNFDDLIRHRGHNIQCVTYGTPERNVAVECEDCNEVLLNFDKNGDKEKSYVVTEVCKDDLREAFRGKAKMRKIIDELTDEQMQRIARKMEDDYVEQLFWGSVRDIVEAYLEDERK